MAYQKHRGQVQGECQRTMSSTTSEDESRDVQALLDKLQNNAITENIAMELEGTFLANHSSKLTSRCSTHVDLQRARLNASMETGKLETERR